VSYKTVIKSWLSSSGIGLALKSNLGTTVGVGKASLSNHPRNTEGPTVMLSFSTHSWNSQGQTFLGHSHRLSYTQASAALGGGQPPIISNLSVIFPPSECHTGHTVIPSQNLQIHPPWHFHMWLTKTFIYGKTAEKIPENGYTPKCFKKIKWISTVSE
jgi:hypothetical protein